MHDRRYKSGTSLTMTKKEEVIDRLERLMGEFSDLLFIELKKLSIPALKELKGKILILNHDHDLAMKGRDST